jgi:hypothetical protein
MRARRATVVGVAAVMAALLGGCQVSVQGAAGLSAVGQKTAAQRSEQAAAVDGALAALAALPAVSYRSTAKDPSGKAAELTVRVTKNGTVLGALPIQGVTVQMAELGGQLYLQAPADYWKAHGAIGDSGDAFAQGWTHADPSDLTVDPGAVLTPAQVSSKLRMVPGASDQLGDPVRVKLADGTEVFRIADKAGQLQVSTAKPYHVVSFAPALLDSATGPVFGAELRPEAVGGDALKTFHTDLDAAVTGLGTPFDSVAQVTVEASDNKLDCDGNSGSCTTSVQVENSLIGGDAQTSSVKLHLTSVLSADVLGTQTCTVDASAAPDTTVPMSCTVRFKVPNRTAEYQVRSMPAVTGEVLVAVDANAVKQKLQTEFSALGG